MDETIQSAISCEEVAIRQQSVDKSDRPSTKAEPSEVNNINFRLKRWGPIEKALDVMHYLTHTI